MTLLAGVQYDRIDDAGLHIAVGGEAKLLEVENVVICAGQESLAEPMPAGRQQGGPAFHKIGGAALPPVPGSRFGQCREVVSGTARQDSAGPVSKGRGYCPAPLLPFLLFLLR